VEILVFITIFWIIPVFVGHAIGRPKHRSGAIWAIFLGWLGVIIVALLPPSKPPEWQTSLDALEKKRGVLSKKAYEETQARLLSEAIHRECPHCKEEMRRDASVCPHCQRDSPPWQLHEGRWWVQVNGEWKWYDELAREWRDPEVPAEGVAT
jgi:hypothetical protein